MVPILLISSICFSIPVVLGIRRGHVREAKEMSVLCALSIWNHGTHHPIALCIDRAYAHVFAVKYGIRAYLQRKQKVGKFILLTYSTGVGLYAIEIRKLNTLLHFGLHICTIVAFSTHMLTKHDIREHNLPKNAPGKRAL